MMSIRKLALDLYQAQQRMDDLQKKYDGAPLGEKTAMTQELNLARNEMRMLRRMLDGEKESGAFRQRFTGFGRSKR
jgi:hypothetical protein